MNCMDPLPHLRRLAKMLPETPVQCPVCKQAFKAIEGFAFLKPSGTPRTSMASGNVKRAT